MRRKLQEYFTSGTRLAWLIDRRKKLVEVYTSPIDKVELSADQVLDGGIVLPDFRVALTSLFAPPPRPRRRGNHN